MSLAVQCASRVESSFLPHILSMPTISADASHALLSLTTSSAFPFPSRLKGDGLRGDEKRPVISSIPFSSSRPCGRVTPVRLLLQCQHPKATTFFPLSLSLSLKNGIGAHRPSNLTNGREVVVALSSGCRSRRGRHVSLRCEVN